MIERGPVGDLRIVRGEGYSLDLSCLINVSVTPSARATISSIDSPGARCRMGTGGPSVAGCASTSSRATSASWP